MAFTTTNVTRGNHGNFYTISGSFTSAAGDSVLTVTHGMSHIVEDRITLDASVGWQSPKVTHSAGVATVTWDDTQGNSGTFYFVGR